MNSAVMGLRVASVLFGLVCLGHIIRLIAALEITIAGHSIPVWLSAIAALVTAGLCVWLWRLSVTSKPPADASPTAPNQPAAPA